MKKKVLILLVISIILVVIVSTIILKVNIKNENKEIVSQSKNIRIEELYEYGKYIESLDIPPNTVVARFNGEEILFHEIKYMRNSINNNEKENKTEGEKSAFYEALTYELYSYIAKKYPNESYEININEQLSKFENEWSKGTENYTVEEYRNKYLDIICIDKDKIWLNEEDFTKYLESNYIELILSSKGMTILNKFMIEKPELAKDSALEEKVKQYKKLKEEIYDSNNMEDFKMKSNNLLKLFEEISETYKKDLILNSDIELCVDKNELSYKVPEITEYINEEKDEKEFENDPYNEAVNNLDSTVFLTDFQNYAPTDNDVKITEKEAKEIAQKGFEESKRIASEGTENINSETVNIEEVCANNYFTRYYYQEDITYNNIKRKCYAIQRQNDMGCGVTIYIDVTTGLIIAGRAFGD